MREITVQVKVKRGEKVDKALRRLKRKLDTEGVMDGIRDKRYFKKPSQIRKEEKNRRKRRARNG
jgi:small subunit ribosomal protein S21|tara:strand:- start:295 stop:486 length:192 start_codon:yes stop_codon:yes gene_type:complete